jgi:hypothetical protein
MNAKVGLLLALGLLQMAADAADLPLLKGLASATLASPAPRVFSAVRGLETYSTRFFIEWSEGGAARSVELTPELYTRIAGPYNRRNVYGAALAYGPVMVGDARTEPMLYAVMRRALCGDAPLLREMGVPVARDRTDMRVRYRPAPRSTGDWPLEIQAPCR